MKAGNEPLNFDQMLRVIFGVFAVCLFFVIFAGDCENRHIKPSNKPISKTVKQ